MPNEDRLTDLLVRYEDAIADGIPITPEQACRDCPDLLADFRQLLVRIGAFQAILDGEGPAADDTPTVDAAGRFQPVSFHARGGLGAVFLAEDAELHRPVALKTMQRLTALDPTARQRFLMEAEVTGRLDHPGVVPVYGVGRDRTGRPYYAMRFIRGQTLADAIRQLHASDRATDDPNRNIEFRGLLVRFVAVCQTVAYAHARGVIHRDIKPGNIMLGPYGETLLVDWGLAKTLTLGKDAETLTEGVAPIASTQDDLSQAGVAKGSPAYMSPEQAQGDVANIGPAADVYGLGATLFVLLTGKPPYQGSSSEVIAKVRSALDAPSPRQVISNVPAPLDAICRKAMASRPGERYASAKALAADVERWLADEPVSVYREPFPVRARRWVKRHRLAVSTAAAALTVAAILLAVLGVVLDVKNRDLAGLNHDLVDRNLALETANQAERKARTEAEHHLHRNLAQLYGVLRFYLGPQQTVAIRRDPSFLTLLDNMERYFTEFVHDAPKDTNGRQALDLVRFLRVINDPTSGLSPDLNRRLTTLQTDLERQMSRAVPTPYQVWLLGSTHNERARRLIESSRNVEARPEVEAAYKILKERAPTDSGPCRTALAMTILLRKQLWDNTGRRMEETADLLVRLDQAIAAMQPKLAEKGMATAAELFRAMAMQQIGSAEEADAALDEIGPVIMRANLHRARGVVKNACRKPEEALADFRLGVESVKEAPPEVADNPILLELAADLQFKAARTALRQKDYRAAWDHIRAAYDFVPFARQNRDLVEEKGLVEQIELSVPEIALAYLGTLSPKSPIDQTTATGVIVVAARALDRWWVEQLDLPVTARNWIYTQKAIRWRADFEAQSKRFGLTHSE